MSYPPVCFLWEQVSVWIVECRMTHGPQHWRRCDKTVKKITHHVPPREMIYTKKQIGWNHKKRWRKTPYKFRNLQSQHCEDKSHLDEQIESIDNKTETQSSKHQDKTQWCVERVPVHCLVTLLEEKSVRWLVSCLTFQTLGCLCVDYDEKMWVFCLLWIDKARATDKMYVWVSVWWKTTN